MSNHMPIYSQVVPKSQYRGKSGSKATSRPQNLARTDFDPLNHNNGGNFQMLNSEGRVEKEKAEKRESRRSKEETGRTRRTQTRNETSEGKVEAYLRQNQVSIRQQQHRHSAVRQAEHRVNLRSLPLNDPVVARGGHDRTPTDRHRGFPERERDGTREHRRERERDRENHEFEGAARGEPAARPVRKSSSAHRVTPDAATIAADRRRFFCREWAFQKIAHCLEQRPASKTCGALILGDAGSGKTALCQELSEPSQGPQARQQRALNRRLLARHFLQSHTESSLRPGEFVRSLAMQILSHSSRRVRAQPPDSPGAGEGAGAAGEREGVLGEEGVDDGEETESPRARRHRRDSEMDRLMERFRGLSDDGEESSKPLLADSEDQRTDEEDLARDVRGLSDAPLTTAQELPEILPRTSAKTTNPFIINTDEHRQQEQDLIYENHENLFLRNISQRQSREMRTSRLQRQSSEPLTDKKRTLAHQSLSVDQKRCADSETERSKTESNSPPKVSRIPVANFRYPNRSELRSSSVDNSPQKTKSDLMSPKRATFELKVDGFEPPEYQNVLAPPEPVPVEVPVPAVVEGPVDPFLCEKRSDEDTAETFLIDFPKKDRPVEDVPPPIPRLPISPRTWIADAYHARLLADPAVQRALLPHNLERAPDECFRRALLEPLLEIEPPKQCLFLLVDAIDEGGAGSGSASGSGLEAQSVAGLLARQQHLFPQWLLLVATARRHSRSFTKMFTGFRKITLDELSRAHVSADVQRYMLARLDTEPRLRARVSSDSAAAAAAAAALDHLRIKSDGCLLYLEKVLDGVADGFIALREIREIPGTLNGLYLWLAQRLFHGRRFTKVRLLLDVLLAARCRCGVTEEMLYKCLLTKECGVTRDDFNRRLHLLRRVLVMEAGTGHLSLFHHSFARWLVDVKHCTRRYLCSAADGHAALAMYYTLEAKRLNAMEVHNYVYHMTCLEQHLAAQGKGGAAGAAGAGSVVDFPLGLHTLVLLWVLDSGCDVDAALRGRTSAVNENKILENDDDLEANGEKSTASRSPLERIMPELSMSEPGEGAGVGAGMGMGLGVGVAGALWPRDARVLRALLELSRADCAGADPADMQIQELLATEQPMEGEEGTEASAEEPEEAAPPDPNVIHELAAKGDDDALAALVKRYPHLVEATDASGGTALHAAARAGRAGAVAALLRAGARADAADADGWSPLRAAAWAGHTEVVEVLLDFGCDVDCVDADNRTALRAAAWSGHLPVVRRLLAAGAAPDRPDAEGRTPLIAAAYMGHADIVRALLDAGACIDHADEDGRTALSVAALCGAGAAGAALLLERGADVARADRDRAQPLLVAAFEGHTEICELLLEAEADIEACDAAGRTALWAAASAGHASTVRLLLFWGACVDSMDGEGRTVLSTAAAQGNVEVVRQLLDRGLDEHHRDNSGWTPLHYAAFEGHIEVCEALLEAGAKVDEADNDGKGPLMLAAQEGHTRLVELLVDEWGAPVDQRAHDGKTALRLAALEGQFECVRALHSRGADPDALDADRRSALYVLALDNRLAMARYMITHCGASVHTTDTEGRTPLHVSAWQGHTDMVNLLVKVGGACVESRDRCARTALHAAAWRGRGAALRALLELGADPAAVCTQGATPLGIAAQEGHEECVLWLLQYGADPQQADHCGRTPAKVAWRAGHAAITRLLERAPRPAPTAPAHAAPTAPPAPTAPAALDEPRLLRTSTSPEGKRRSVHSSNSTKSSSNLTGGSARSHETAAVSREPLIDPALHDKQANRANLSLSFAQQVARCGRGRRERERDSVIPEHRALEQDDNLRSYLANERDAELRGYRRERDGRRDARHGGEGAASPLYASPPRSPVSDLCSPTQPLPGTQPASLPAGAGAGTGAADTHFNRDTHMRIILGRDCKPPPDRSDSEAWSGRGRFAYTKLVGSITRARGKIFKKTKNKRNGIVTNPAMRLVANVRNGLDSAAANIRRTGVALAASASSANPAVRSNAFQWRKETHL